MRGRWPYRGLRHRDLAVHHVVFVLCFFLSFSIALFSLFESPLSFSPAFLSHNTFLLPSRSMTLCVVCRVSCVYVYASWSDALCPLGTVSESETLYLNCADGSTIQNITFASFGTPLGVCGSYAVSSCHAAASVRSRCVNFFILYSAVCRLCYCLSPAINKQQMDVVRSLCRSVVVFR